MVHQNESTHEVAMKNHSKANWTPQSAPSDKSFDLHTPVNAAPLSKLGAAYARTTNDDYVQSMMGSSISELGANTDLPDASQNPGMSLLFSLSDRIDSSVESATFELAPPSTSESSASQILNENVKPDAFSSMIHGSVPLYAESGLLLSSQMPPFDHAAHLDTIASVASAAAATQYEEAAAYQVKHQSSMPSMRASTVPPLSPTGTMYNYSTARASDGDIAMTRQASHQAQNGVEKCETKAKASQRPPVRSSASLGSVLSSSATISAINRALLTNLNTASMDLPDGANAEVALSHNPDSGGKSHTSVQSDTGSRMFLAELQPSTSEASASALAPLRPNELLKRTRTPSHDDTKRLKNATHEGPTRASEAVQKRFQCPKCSRAFARAYNLSTHLSTHDPDPSRAKPFSCPYRSCRAEGGRSFSRKHDLQRHVASVHEWEPEPGIHGDSGEIGEGKNTGGLASLGLGAPGKKFRCEQCGRAFVRRDALRRHHCDAAALQKQTGGCSTHCSKEVRADVPPTFAPSFAVRSFPGDVVQRVTLQLMNKADSKPKSALYAAEQPIAVASSTAAADSESPSRMQQAPSPNMATTSVN